MNQMTMYSMCRSMYYQINTVYDDMYMYMQTVKLSSIMEAREEFRD